MLPGALVDLTSHQAALFGVANAAPGDARTVLHALRELLRPQLGLQITIHEQQFPRRGFPSLLVRAWDETPGQFNMSYEYLTSDRGRGSLGGLGDIDVLFDKVEMSVARSFVENV